jgi:hypothetical protein
VRTLLIIPLWLSKIAFLCFFFGNRDHLSKAQRWILYAVFALNIAMFVAVLWATFEMYAPPLVLPLMPEDVV